MVTKRLKLALWWERIETPLRLALFILGASLFALIVYWVYWQRPEFEIENFSSNLTFFILINLNIALLFVFAFLVARNIVKLVFDRRRNILGSKLKQKLIFAFGGLTLVPTIIIFVLSSGMLSHSMEEIFSNNILETISSANDLAQSYCEIIENNFENISKKIEKKINDLHGANSAKTINKNIIDNKNKDNKNNRKNNNRKNIEEIFSNVIASEKIFNISLVDKDSNIIANSSKENIFKKYNLPLDFKAVSETISKGVSRSVFNNVKEAQVIRFYYPIKLNGVSYGIVLMGLLDENINKALLKVEETYNEYQNLLFHKNPIRSSYLLTLAMMTMLILFAAIWIAFYIAKEITIPIEKLANATKQVALGDYDCSIKIIGDDELSYLSRSFNTMLSDLKQSKNETERHRLFMETVLSNLAVGVITLDKNRKLIAVNSAASDILSIKSGVHDGTKSLNDIFDKHIADKLINLLNDASLILDEFSAGMTDTEFTIRAEGREYQIVCTAGAIVDNVGDTLGSVLIFDDVTDLSHAQKMAAWREVARRIAHEIKNPLTPIKLSAQRIKGNATKDNLPKLYEESSTMIVEQVEIIKRLIDEFSNFARMPTSSFERVDVVSFLKEIISSFSENNSDIEFISDFEENELEVSIDVGQMRLVLLNLFENAMQALRNGKVSNPKIHVKLSYLKKIKSFSIEVADNGPGISDFDKTRIFEPYFTTKETGTGLGLAIVTSVISDHRGRIRTFDNKPKGAKFIITLPIFQSDAKTKTQRFN
ncbi:MAG: ATP-binding protein [Bdellovibrionota bacterium]